MNEGTTFLKSEKEMKLRKWFWQLISLFSLNENIFFLQRINGSQGHHKAWDNKQC